MVKGVIRRRARSVLLCQGIEQQVDARAVLQGDAALCSCLACDEGPDIRPLQITLNPVPLRGDLGLAARVLFLHFRQQDRLEQLRIGQRNAALVQAGEQRDRLFACGDFVPDDAHRGREKTEHLIDQKLLVLQPHLVCEPASNRCMGLVHVEVVDVLFSLRGIKFSQVRLAARPGLVFQVIAGLALVHEAQQQPQGRQALLAVDQLPFTAAQAFYDDGLQAVALAGALPDIV